MYSFLRRKIALKEKEGAKKGKKWRGRRGGREGEEEEEEREVLIQHNPDSRLGV